MTSIRNLSDDFLVEIVSWLPVDSLIRLKCVDKYWYCLVSCVIKCKLFVAKHIKNSNRRSYSPILLLRSPVMYKGHRGIRNKDMLLRILCNDNEDDHLETMFEFLDSSYVGCGCHCNGIICTYYSWHTKAFVALYNPALRDLRVIRGSCFGEGGRFNRYQTVTVGFGHDPIADVYKVIRFVGLDSFRARWEAEIHTVGVDGDNSWRKLHKVDPTVSCINLRDLDSHAVYCNGYYYWSVDTYSRHMLLSLDMHSEKFQIILTPFPWDCYTVRTKLALWNNDSQVAVFRYALRGDVPIQVWVLHNDKASNNYSWTKHLTISPLEQFIYPCLFWNNDKELLFIRNPGSGIELASYNLRSGKVRRLQGMIKQILLMTGSYVFSYVQSLVSFD